MKLTLRSTLMAAALGCTLWAAPAMAQSGDRKCGTMEALARMVAENPDLAKKMQDIESHTAEYVKAREMGRAQTISVTIPVVVHVVYRSGTPSDNISDAQVKSQIDVLNADYSKTNADITKVPSVFAPLAASQQVTFCLAAVDPNGNATTGIRRVATAQSSFSSNDGVKKTSTGGDDAWDATKYLNIWVCNLGGGLLGYAQFPGGAAATDGVVILNTAFGNTGTAAAPYGLGRSATHEVGHWLNLRHIWGDANCGDDLVSDTPTQQTSNFSCPTFPHVTCSNGPNGDMFMNYMDYVDDACMQMFSAGQVARSNALFAAGGARVGFVSSTQCVAGPPPTCVTASSLAATSVGSSTATISWVSNGAATSYNVQYGPVGGTQTTTSTTGTSLNLTGLAVSTAYQFAVQTVCASGSQPYSAVSNFTTTAVVVNPYCANAGGSTVDEWIASFQLGTISKTTGTGSGYVDYSGSTSTNLLPGSSYTATYKTGYRATAYKEYYRAWIDYNGNGSLDDAGETIFSRTSSSTANLTSTFTIPATAKLGHTRLRVSLKYGAYEATSCTAYGTGYGQVQDYTVIIGSGARQAAGTMAVDLAPNPSSDLTLVHATLPQGAESANVIVTDLQGRQVWSAANVAASAGRIEGFAVPVNNLKPGVYMLQVEAAGSRKTVRLSVQ